MGMNDIDPKKTYVNTALIGANVLWFFFLTSQGRTEYDMTMMLRYGACYEPLIVYEHQYWRLLAACFMHFGIAHLVNNMLVLFALGDVIALGAMRALWDLGLRIPQDISVVGYDDIASAQFCYPRLTTIRQDTAALAEKGVQTLLRQLSQIGAPVHEIIPFQLCERESVQSKTNSESTHQKG